MTTYSYIGEENGSIVVEVDTKEPAVKRITKSSKGLEKANNNKNLMFSSMVSRMRKRRGSTVLSRYCVFKPSKSW